MKTIKHIYPLLLLLLVTSGCAQHAVQFAPAIDPATPTAVKVYVIRTQELFVEGLDSDFPWVLDMDNRSLCELDPGEYAVLDTVEGGPHWLTVKRLLGWWHSVKEPIISEPDTDYFFLTGVRQNSMYLERVDAETAAAYMTESSLVCSPPPAPVPASGKPPVAATTPASVPEAAAKRPQPKPTPTAAPTPGPPPPTGAKVQEIYFDLDRAEIKPEMVDDLDAVVGYLKRHQSAIVVLGGHACDLGPEAYNLQLSKRRNHAVRDYLLKAGIKKGRIGEEAFGESRPKYSNKTADGRRHNRRVEFRFVDGL